MSDSLLVRSLGQVAEMDAQTWDALNAQAGGSMLTSHRFLNAFEQSQSVCPDTGWQPHHLLIQEDNARAGAPADTSTATSTDTPANLNTRTDTNTSAQNIVAVVPLYVKGHSYGEFVFDWAWADAYQRAGLRYYPKWLAGVPFTPVTSARLLCAPEDQALAAQALLQTVKATNLSSLHVLYTTASEQACLERAGCLTRHHTQFHWHNPGWSSFDDFLAQLTQPKRKKVRAERRKVQQAGVVTTVKTGADITEADWDFFYRCYDNTYAERGNPPYLRRDFFRLVDPECCVMVLAHLDAQPIASSLLWFDTVTDPAQGKPVKKLYGRYWGCVQHLDCLHFEVAYYTPIQWAIDNGIDIIEGGAQGEHKMARGFTPVQTRSAHWLAHEGFTNAVADYLDREKRGLAAYNDALGSPFKTKGNT